MAVDNKTRVIIGIWVIDISVALWFGFGFSKAILYVIVTSILVALWTEYVYRKKVRVGRWL